MRRNNTTKELIKHLTPGNTVYSILINFTSLPYCQQYTQEVTFKNHPGVGCEVFLLSVPTPFIVPGCEIALKHYHDLWSLYPVSMVTQLPSVLSRFAFRSCCGIDSGKLIQTQLDKECECILPLIPAARPVGLSLPSWKGELDLCWLQLGQALMHNFSVSSSVRVFHGVSFLL